LENLSRFSAVVGLTTFFCLPCPTFSGQAGLPDFAGQAGLPDFAGQAGLDFVMNRMHVRFL